MASIINPPALLLSSEFLGTLRTRENVPGVQHHGYDISTPPEQQGRWATQCNLDFGF
jgi:hypothetical protein